MDELRELVSKIIENIPVQLDHGSGLYMLLALGIVVITVALIEILLRLLFLRSLPKLLTKIKGLENFDISNTKIVPRIIRIISVHLFSELLSIPYPGTHIVKTILGTLALVYIAILVVQVIGSIFDACRYWMLTHEKYRANPFVNMFQAIKIIVYFIGALYIISLLFGIDMRTIFGSLAALSAVLMLVFKDTLLGFVASLQLSGNNMVEIGDWISVPGTEVDGDVEDISLTTIKVRSFDKTIYTIPPYSLISSPFQNWSGMQRSGGRRMCREIYVDMKTIQFIDEEFVHKLQNTPALQPALKNVDLTQEKDNFSNMTNVRLFRRYIQAYLMELDTVKKDGFTCMVRHRDMGDQGLPIQLYFFTNTTVWAEYEEIVSEIFEHLLAVIPYFGLEVFQRSASRDQLRLNINSDGSETSVEVEAAGKHVTAEAVSNGEDK